MNFHNHVITKKSLELSRSSNYDITSPVSHLGIIKCGFYLQNLRTLILHILNEHSLPALTSTKGKRVTKPTRGLSHSTKEIFFLTRLVMIY